MTCCLRNGEKKRSKEFAEECHPQVDKYTLFFCQSALVEQIGDKLPEIEEERNRVVKFMID